MEEPMTIGSPQSPNRSSYLPNYLLNTASPRAPTSSPNPALASPFGTKPVSPLDRRKVVFSKGTLVEKSPLIVQERVAAQSTPYADRWRHSDLDASKGDKSHRTGPPVTGYFEPEKPRPSLGTPRRIDASARHDSFLNKSSALNSSRLDNKSFLNTSYQASPNISLEVSRAAPEELDQWITVFGFPPASASFVMQEFALSGTIVEHRFCNSTNWMHVKLSNALQTQKALNKNGKIIGRNIMIGVRPCSDVTVLSPANEGQENAMLNSTAPSGDTNESLMGRSMSCSVLRPLANNRANVASDITFATLPTQQKSLVSRAVDYFLGSGQGQ